MLKSVGWGVSVTVGIWWKNVGGMIFPIFSARRWISAARDSLSSDSIMSILSMIYLTLFFWSVPIK